MIRIEPEPWRQMVEHAQATYPNECCGAMLGSMDGERKMVRSAMPLENVSEGDQRVHYVVRPLDMVAAEKEAIQQGLSLLGFYHSHPDCDAYFSKTDRENSFWYSFLVLSIRNRQFANANCYRPNSAGDDFELEELSY
jgi:proteasome lid subunit RPN8/RPN11